MGAFLKSVKGTLGPRRQYRFVVSPCKFKELNASGDITVIERSVCREVFEEVNGERVQAKPNSGNQMAGATAGVI
jgi:hypothetical protein